MLLRFTSTVIFEPHSLSVFIIGEAFIEIVRIPVRPSPCMSTRSSSIRPSAPARFGENATASRRSTAPRK
jgi:hypothetical protein